MNCFEGAEFFTHVSWQLAEADCLPPIESPLHLFQMRFET